MADMQAVQFDRYGDVDVLDVRAVPRPAPQPDEVLVQSAPPASTLARQRYATAFSGTAGPRHSPLARAATLPAL
jgi:hypothetical protein